MLGEKLRALFDKFSTKQFLTKDNIAEFNKELQRTLIASDVDIEVVFDLSKQVENLASEKVPDEISLKEYFIKKVYDLLAEIFGTTAEVPQNPKRILLCGLYGSGKTTSAVKLANYYKKKFNKKVGIIGADIYRPGAYEQIVQGIKKNNLDTMSYSETSKDISSIVKNGLRELEKCDLIILDSAGRSSLDNELKQELSKINNLFKPDYSFLVLSADIGQIAKKEVDGFSSILGINGIIITKMDGSGKGGSALIACKKTKAPVYFIGTGEKLEDIATFDPVRYLSKIMGYGDLQELMEKFSDLESGDLNLKHFDLNDFKKQMKTLKKAGSFTKLAGMLGLGKIDKNVMDLADDKFKKYEHILDSMTEYEKKNPDVLKSSRVNRIAKGSGTYEKDVRDLLKQYNMMKDMFGNAEKLQGMDEKDLDPKSMMSKLGFDKKIMKMQRKKMKFKLK